MILLIIALMEGAAVAILVNEHSWALASFFAVTSVLMFLGTIEAAIRRG